MPGPNYFIAGLILAIMIIPIVSAITREVMATVPLRSQGGGARARRDALGDDPHGDPARTRAPASPAPRCSGLGRAIGETIAVTLVIGNAPTIGKQIFDQGYSLAAVIANEFGEAANNPLHRSALIAAGLVLFVLTLIVNRGARWYFVAPRSRVVNAWPRARRQRVVSGMTTLVAISPARRRKDRIMRGVLAAGTGIALVPLVLVIYYLIKRASARGAATSSRPTRTATSSATRAA